MTVRLRSALDGLPSYAPGRNVPGAVKLASNELSFPTLPSVAQAIGAFAAEGAIRGLNRYPDNAANDLAEQLAALAGAPRENLVVGGGSVALCHQIAEITVDAGDEVIYGWRSFETYPIVTGLMGGRAVQIPVTAAQELDLAAMADAVTDRTRLVFVCTPNNPTGTAVRKDQLDALLDAVPEDVLVVVDEAYREFDVDPESPNGVELALSRPNVLALRTLSKAYGLAGLRVGYAVGPLEVVAALRRVAIPFAVNSLAQVAAVAALKHGELFVPRWEQVVAERDRVSVVLRANGFEVPPSQANFVWLPLAEEATAFAAHCEEYRVIVRPFPDAAGGVRVSIGSPDENDQFLAAAETYPG